MVNLKQELSRGFRYTVVLFHHQYGYLECHHIKLVCVSVKLIHAMDKIPSTMLVNEGPPGVGKFIIIKQKSQFVIWKGHHKVNTSILVNRSMEKTDCGEVMVERKWPAFDGRYLERAKRSVPIKPVIEKINPIGPEELKTYQCIS